jgi:hypothetical protein
VQTQVAAAAVEHLQMQQCLLEAMVVQVLSFFVTQAVEQSQLARA